MTDLVNFGIELVFKRDHVKFNTLSFLSELNQQLGDNPKVICGIADEVISFDHLALKDVSKFDPMKLEKLKKIQKVIISFHGYGERAETQLRRMQKLELPTSILWICPQALHPALIKNRQGRTDIPEVDKIAWSWMAKKTRDRDIRWNREYMMSIYDDLRSLLGTIEKMNDSSDSSRKTVEDSGPHMIILGHSQGGSQAWRTASWIPCDELIIHAGDIPPELRRQWPVHMKKSLKKVTLGRGRDDEIMKKEILNRDVGITNRMFEQITEQVDRSESLVVETWDGQGTHAWEGDWVEYLSNYLNP